MRQFFKNAHHVGLVALEQINTNVSYFLANFTKARNLVSRYHICMGTVQVLGVPGMPVC